MEIGVEIMSVGLGDCHDLISNVTTLCGKRGCWPTVKVGDSFDILDGNSTSIVGPSISLVPKCGCRSPTKDNIVENKSESLLEHPAAHAVKKNKKHSSCKRNSCLNGGRCIPVGTTFK